MRREEKGEMKEVGSITEHTQSILRNIIDSTILKRLTEISILAVFLALMMCNSKDVRQHEEIAVPVKTVELSEHYEMLHATEIIDETEEIRNEIFYGELETLAILVQAEAGNQDELGQRYVADCVLNRVDDKEFPDKIEDVIYQMDPVQFATTVNGAMGKAGYDVKEETFNLVLEEYESRKDSRIIYFRTDKFSECGHPAFKYGDHYFSTK